MMLNEDINDSLQAYYKQLSLVYCLILRSLIKKTQVIFSYFHCVLISSQLYLHSTSCHKPSSINSIQKCAALRLRRICSMTKKYQNKAKEYSSYLVTRGHNPKTVKSTFNKIDKVLRSVARKKKNPSITTTSVIFSAESTWPKCQ